MEVIGLGYLDKNRLLSPVRPCDYNIPSLSPRSVEIPSILGFILSFPAMTLPPRGIDALPFGCRHRGGSPGHGGEFGYKYLSFSYVFCSQSQ
jgi:hypothetical protein